MKFRLSCICEMACIVTLLLTFPAAAQEVDPAEAPSYSAEETELSLTFQQDLAGQVSDPQDSEPQGGESQDVEPTTAAPPETPVESQGVLVEQSRDQPTKTIEDLSELSFVVRMKVDKYLQGVPADFAYIDCFVLGTKITVPLDEVIGVRFPEKPGERGSLALKNGEILNGRIEVLDLNLAVEWGEAHVSREYIKSMVRTAELYWQLKDTANGPRWFLAPRTANVDRSGAVSRPAPSRVASQLVARTILTKLTPQLYADVYPAVDPQEFDWILVRADKIGKPTK